MYTSEQMDQMDQCPYRDRWEGAQRAFIAAWAISEFDPEEFDNHYDFNLCIKVDGKWPTLTERDDWPKRNFPPHPGHTKVIAAKKYGRYNSRYRFYLSREMAGLIFQRLSKKMYVSEALERRITDRMDGKYGKMNGHGHAIPQRWQYGMLFEGPFTPVEMQTAKPAAPIHCSICGALVGALSLNTGSGHALGGRLLDNWGEYLRMWHSVALRQRRVCESPACAQIAQWRDTGHSGILEQTRAMNIKANRPAKATLAKYPTEIQGPLVLSRYLDYEARYQERKEEMT